MRFVDIYFINRLVVFYKLKRIVVYIKELKGVIFLGIGICWVVLGGLGGSVKWILIFKVW